MIQVLEFYANSIDNFVRAYLKNYFNASIINKHVARLLGGKIKYYVRVSFVKKLAYLYRYVSSEAFFHDFMNFQTSIKGLN